MVPSRGRYQHVTYKFRTISKSRISICNDFIDRYHGRVWKPHANELRGLVKQRSISSLGGIGGTGFTPIVNAPEVAILGVSKAATKPVWNGKEFAPRLILPLSLSYDHRVIDGALAARFASFLATQLGDIRRLLL